MLDAASYYNKVRGERGQTMVEFALILLLILIILFGITEFGRAWFFSNALNNGVRDGARYASTLKNYSSFTAYQNKVRNYTFARITSVIDRDNLAVDVEIADDEPPAGLSAGDFIKVSADYDFQVLTGGIIPVFSGTKTLEREATMRRE